MYILYTQSTKSAIILTLFCHYLSQAENDNVSCNAGGGGGGSIGGGGGGGMDMMSEMALKLQKMKKAKANKVVCVLVFSSQVIF